jgi:predicted DNA-binding transcriptional regulator AlpA
VSTAVRRKTLTIGELYDQPALMDLPTLAVALSIAESTCYLLAAKGRLPVEAVRLGRKQFVRTAEVLAWLHLPENSEAPGARTPEASVEPINKTAAKQIGENS